MLTHPPIRLRSRPVRSTGLLLALATLALAACDATDAPTRPSDVERTLVTSISRDHIRIVIGQTGNLGPSLTTLRSLLGDPNNGGGPAAATGRREINWDGVPTPPTNTDAFPGNFFNNRGVIFSTAGTGFRVSDNDFADVDASYGAQFQFFSPSKTFASRGSNIMHVIFRVPGTGIVGRTNGFGVVFSDVDKVLSTRLRFFDDTGQVIGVVFAPKRKDAAGHSLAAMVFDSPVIASVEIKAGEAAIGAGVRDIGDGGTFDVVVMDDFLYGEPQPQP